MTLGLEPGAGKPNAINLIVARGALSCDCRLVLINGKQVEFGRLTSGRRSPSAELGDSAGERISLGASPLRL